jgi:hypothetical protein
MSNEELVGRIAALEVIAMTALGLHLANARNDPDYQKSLLANLRDALTTQAASLPAAAQKHATSFGKHLLDAVARNLQALRRDDSRLN